MTDDYVVLRESLYSVDWQMTEEEELEIDRSLVVRTDGLRVPSGEVFAVIGLPKESSAGASEPRQTNSTPGAGLDLSNLMQSEKPKPAVIGNSAAGIFSALKVAEEMAALKKG